MELNRQRLVRPYTVPVANMYAWRSFSEAAMFNPRCDLVQTSYVSIGGDQDTRTLSVGYSWDKKQRSYDNIGTFDHYLVRHGPVQNGSDIIESEARYLPISNVR